MIYQVTVDLTVRIDVEADDGETAAGKAGAELGMAFGGINGEILERGRMVSPMAP